jgi:hypothetical protein
MMNPLQDVDPPTIGDFRLIARLGSGGMGQLYVGAGTDGSLAAVKVIRPDQAHDATFRARFRREIAAARKATGTHTARILGADPDDAQPWLATEYIPGPSLAEAVARFGPFLEPAARVLMAGLCLGLTQLHDAGLVHRDLKPGNVLLTPSGPRIIDFGVSRVFDASVLTHTGQLVGSPGFMAPEQAVGSGDAGPPADIFALGAVLCFALTGDSPFGTGLTPAVVYRVVHEPPDLDRLPSSLRTFIAACLEKDPALRPSAADVLARLGPAEAAAGWLPAPVEADIRSRIAELAELRRCGADTPTVLRPARRRPTAAPAPRRRGRRTVAVAAAAAAALAIAGGATWPRWAPVASSTTAAAEESAPSRSPVASPSVVVVPGAGRSVTPTVVAGAGRSVAPAVVVEQPEIRATSAAAAAIRKSATRRPGSPKPSPEAKRSAPPPTIAPRRTEGDACFTTSIPGGLEVGAGFINAGGPNFTSDLCTAIHIRLTSAEYRTYARSCLETPDGEKITRCSDWVTLTGSKTWDTLSTGVAGGTRWQLQMYADGPESARFFYTA